MLQSRPKYLTSPPRRDSGLLEQLREPERRIQRNLKSTRNVAARLRSTFPDSGKQLTPHVGQIVDVTVTSVQTYGIFCADDDHTQVLVLIPELSWTASFCSCKQFANVGDSITVKILHIDDESGKIVASIRQIFANPWATDAFREGRRYTAKVIRHVQSADRCNNSSGYLLELVPGAFVMLCASDLALVPGDACGVEITRVLPDARAVTVTLTN
ncbi:General stress protein 13 [Allorhodopirellula heiligendammensis]|uniref:General stress protein 13 n=2 Tax=Allorhodopirellula heiligendammensis TaxID=2714739 RepID=A0A5C6C4V6_9BACT|nr:General stress protein 13 [Allorhodopirellula heiligendammensis]